MNCNGKELNLDQPIAMGILNATPDSFYNKGRVSSLDEIVTRAIEMIGEGASILDIGGQSTRPHAEMISVEEELNRVIPVIQSIHEKFPSTILSIDTFRSEVANAAIEVGADIINDVSGGELDPLILEIAVKHKVPYICMHMKGTPETMQDHPHYENVVKEVYAYFEQKINHFHDLGLEQIILDPGFGFGKTIQHNYQLLAYFAEFNTLQQPMLAGLSRKSMIYRPLGSNADEALNGTTALNMIALRNGASILRVHDVCEAMECITLFKLLQEANSLLS